MRIPVFFLFFFQFFFVGPLASAAQTCEIELKDKDICLHLEWTRGPVWGGFSKAKITYWKKSSAAEKTPVDPPKDLIVYPWMIMPTMEHGGRTPSVKKLGTGSYEVDQLQFMKMPGHWELRWRHQKDDEKEAALAKVKVPLPEE